LLINILGYPAHFYELLDDRLAKRLEITRIAHVVKAVLEAALKKELGHLIKELLEAESIERRRDPFCVFSNCHLLLVQRLLIPVPFQRVVAVQLLAAWNLSVGCREPALFGTADLVHRMKTLEN